ncbi:MAG: hypothetical protein ACSLFQ_13225 [Thermoanaerobaculia bacterium]
MNALHKHLLHFLAVLHQSPRAAGIEELAKQNPALGDPRKIYRWQRALGDDLIYYPTVSFRALGLEHLHLFIDKPQIAWDAFPYAVSAEWVVSGLGARTLYLHCIVPVVHREEVAALLRWLEESGACTQVTNITTHDSWQIVHDKEQEDPVPSGVLSPVSVRAWDIVERLPLLIPVIFEATEQRRSLPAIWDAVYARLGKNVWEYLPRFSRRMPRNGKAYVNEAFAILNHTGLFRQNVVRYKPFDAVCTPMFLHVEGQELPELIADFAPRAPLLDVHPIAENAALLRISTTHAQTRYVLTTASSVPRIKSWYFIDLLQNEREPLHPRFAYELLFDAATTQWLFPREEIIARLYR